METGCDTRTPMALCKKARSSQRAWTTSALLGKAPCYAKIYQYKNAVCTQESPFQRFSRMGWWHLLFFKSRSAWTGCITRCLHFRTKWTTMFGEIEIGVWWILNGNSHLIPEAWRMWGRILIGFIHHDCRWGPMQFMTATFQCQVQLSCVVLAWFLWILMLTGVSSECAWCSDRSEFHPWLQSGGMHLKDAMWESIITRHLFV